MKCNKAFTGLDHPTDRSGLSSIGRTGGKDDAFEGMQQSVDRTDAGVKHEILIVKQRLAAGTSRPNWEIRHAK